MSEVLRLQLTLADVREDCVVAAGVLHVYVHTLCAEVPLKHIRTGQIYTQIFMAGAQANVMESSEQILKTIQHAMERFAKIQHQNQRLAHLPFAGPAN